MSLSAILNSKKRIASRMSAELGLNLELTPDLKDCLIAYQIAMATARKEQDALIAAMRDHIHSYLKQSGYGDPRELHAVIDIMDEMLRRSKQ